MGPQWAQGWSISRVRIKNYVGTNVKRREREEGEEAGLRNPNKEKYISQMS